jgi:hypothetical protein
VTGQTRHPSYHAARAAGKRYRIVNARGVIARSLRIAGLLELPGIEPAD